MAQTLKNKKHSEHWLNVLVTLDIMKYLGLFKAVVENGYGKAYLE